MTDVVTKARLEGSPEQLFCDPAPFVDIEGWHRAVDLLRPEGPFLRLDDPYFHEMWAVTGIDTLLEISRHADLFPNTDKPVLIAGLEHSESAENLTGGLKMLINQDGQDHLDHRKLVVEWFKNSTLRVLKPAVDQLVAESIAHLRDLDGECDFATEVALPLPLRVIMSMLGVPREDEPLLLKLTQEMFSSDDAELGDGDPLAALMEVAAYFSTLFEERQANPTDDLSSAIANGVVADEPIEVMVAIGLYVIIATAGHDTTSFAMSGGMDALTRFPDEFQRIRANPDLVDGAAHEMVRLTSPVRHFIRHAAADVEIQSHQFHPGDRVLLSYPAANRDGSMFADPHRFDAGRANSNRHVGWGHGPHFCLGARLAHMEVAAVLDGLRREATAIEATGPTQWTPSFFVGGAKHVPIKCHF